VKARSKKPASPAAADHPVGVGADVLRLSSKECARLEAVAAKSGTTPERWLRNAVLAAVAGDEAHFEEMAARDFAAAAVDRDRLRRLLNKNGHGSEPSKETLDLITEQIAVARTEGRAGLELVARACRSVVIAAGVAFEKTEAPPAVVGRGETEVAARHEKGCRRAELPMPPGALCTCSTGGAS
jgi:hypothetical protein